MTDLIVTVAGTVFIAAAGYALAILWMSRPRPVRGRDGVWRAAPRNRGVR